MYALFDGDGDFIAHHGWFVRHVIMVANQQL